MKSQNMDLLEATKNGKSGEEKATKSTNKIFHKPWLAAFLHDFAYFLLVYCKWKQPIESQILRQLSKICSRNRSVLLFFCGNRAF